MKALVKSIPQSFRRAGIAFTRVGIVVDLAELTEAQRIALGTERNLDIQILEPTLKGAIGSLELSRTTPSESGTQDAVGNETSVALATVSAFVANNDPGIAPDAGISAVGSAYGHPSADEAPVKPSTKSAAKAAAKPKVKAAAK